MHEERFLSRKEHRRNTWDVISPCPLSSHRLYFSNDREISSSPNIYIYILEEFHPWKKNERRRIQQLKNFQLVSHSMLLCSDVCKTDDDSGVVELFSFEIVAPIADRLKTRFESASIIFRATSSLSQRNERYISDKCTWLNRIFLHCW